jgi:hypothetical protein
LRAWLEVVQGEAALGGESVLMACHSGWIGVWCVVAVVVWRTSTRHNYTEPGVLRKKEEEAQYSVALITLFPR